MPTIAITRPYEAVYIVDPDLGEEQVQAIIGRYRQIVESNGGAVTDVRVWERRKLAYEIKGRTEGIYVVMQFTGTSKAEAELRRIFQISEDQIRAMIVKQDRPAPPAEEAASAPSAAPAQAPAPVEAPAPAPPVAEVQATENNSQGESPAVAAEPAPVAEPAGA